VDSSYKQSVARVLTQRGIDLERGLSNAEFDAVESRFGLRFPPDLADLLATFLPTTSPFPDWRHGTEEDLREQVVGPVEGIIFDVEENAFWFAGWGVQPTNRQDAVVVARAALSTVPPLVPVFAHRYMPSDPLYPGNPVFSVVQTDVIYYGNDLTDYLFNEFRVPNPYQTKSRPRRIEFWSALVEKGQQRVR
jgi:hypothetical protein